MTSWWTSAVQTVRDKSIDALDFVRRDLNEFTTTVKTDTESYLNKIKIQEVGDLGINRFVSKLNNSIKTNHENEIHFPSSASFDRIHNELKRLQNDELTYLNDPIPIEAYENWRQTSNFNVETRKGDIAQLLIDAPHVRAFYAHLVPAQTTHSDFWSRYYYRVHQIEEEEARRIQLLKRAHEICSENNENTEKNNVNDWDEPEEEWSQGSTNITEEFKSKYHEEQQESKFEHPEKKEEEEEEQQESKLEHPEKKEEEQESKFEQKKEEEQQQQININLEEPNHERTESDAVSGDSWEREFDETDLTSSKSHINPLIQSEETITSDSLSSSTITTIPLVSSSILDKKSVNEFDDEWESWS